MDLETALEQIGREATRKAVKLVVIESYTSREACTAAGITARDLTNGLAVVRAFLKRQGWCE
jgi:hypothetical protein